MPRALKPILSDSASATTPRTTGSRAVGGAWSRRRAAPRPSRSRPSRPPWSRDRRRPQLLSVGFRTATAQVETPRIITPSSTAWPPPERPCPRARALVEGRARGGHLPIVSAGPAGAREPDAAWACRSHGASGSRAKSVLSLSSPPQSAARDRPGFSSAVGRRGPSKADIRRLPRREAGIDRAPRLLPVNAQPQSRRRRAAALSRVRHAHVVTPGAPAEGPCRSSASRRLGSGTNIRHDREVRRRCAGDRRPVVPAVAHAHAVGRAALEAAHPLAVGERPLLARTSASARGRARGRA